MGILRRGGDRVETTRAPVTSLAEVRAEIAALEAEIHAGGQERKKLESRLKAARWDLTIHSGYYGNDHKITRADRAAYNEVRQQAQDLADRLAVLNNRLTKIKRQKLKYEHLENIRLAKEREGQIRAAAAELLEAVNKAVEKHSVYVGMTSSFKLARSLWPAGYPPLEERQVRTWLEKLRNFVQEEGEKKQDGSE